VTTGVFVAMLLIGLFSAPALAASAARRQVVLTTDCGAEVDDQWALAHLALCPEIELLGVVTTHAPNLAQPAAESSARVAREVLAHLHLHPTPRVIAGSSEPLADKTHPRLNDGVAFLREQARAHSPDDRLIVLIIGPATDVASALLADPAFGDRIAIVAMGFDGWPEGRDPWNVKNDVKAWQLVLESSAPIVVGDARVTKRHLQMGTQKARSLFQGGEESGSFLATLLDDWLAKNGPMAESVTGSRSSWPIWDEVVTAYLLGLTKTETRPRPRLRDDVTFDHSQPRGTITWITEIDTAGLWDDLVAKLSRVRAK
jgi:inosine-uridine nucleoside N-ribohydrolase